MGPLQARVHHTARLTHTGTHPGRTTIAIDAVLQLTHTRGGLSTHRAPEREAQCAVFVGRKLKSSLGCTPGWGVMRNSVAALDSAARGPRLDTDAATRGPPNSEHQMATLLIVDNAQLHRKILGAACREAGTALSKRRLAVQGA